MYVNEPYWTQCANKQKEKILAGQKQSTSSFEVNMFNLESRKKWFESQANTNTLPMKLKVVKTIASRDSGEKVPLNAI